MTAAFKHVLVATDGSPLADKALELALRLGSTARITALLVAQDYGLPEYVLASMQGRADANTLREATLTEARRVLDECVARAGGDATRIQTRVVLSGQPTSHEIAAWARQEGCDLIVMGSRGFGGRWAGLLGSQSLRVLSLSTVPVLIAR